MRTLILKYKTMLSYLFFGVLTTLVNMTVYYVCYQGGNMSNTGSTAAAWLVSVVFAFVTNKQYVFDGGVWTLRGALGEGIRFAGGRLGTGAVELVLMYLTVDLLGFPGILMKAAANVLVIVLNYVISKKWIFQTD
ncbi:GtrA family protein [Bariatricus massiliensis]|uniref:GtrA family protein n=1 Tax=Bariatricus massiliensis TaxID=1745713 RepID=A0ABS8DKR8_9FIRM|nr:GtrA family protein [Bariatricus massiliensis]MCB7305817.1 GtrA family protein [Bariatricus massiliensis]MCB7376430.1 GtrA family protein [Bariatricus massiliensis]MCB7388960.1 GtrA family protein [Bariatricus massiliensis]MCB7413133.1 GtrA family protein [Bariatricus massiliensis]